MMHLACIYRIKKSRFINVAKRITIAKGIGHHIPNPWKWRSMPVFLQCMLPKIFRNDVQAFDHCPRGSFGFPGWLELSLVCGLLNEIMLLKYSSSQGDHKVEEFVDDVPQNS
ncbi:unnamed protein product [Cuscuta epithymum]|uniref:IP5PC-F immunoglobulin-like domain-containing protein n=1 Tax=Cuscuta epithymum TaxID=186058 RepID=A0AAV0BXB2_9ASTE|nr:unnamed protein product [Cuscuta epithymum]